MWFLLSLVALSMLVARRSVEKSATQHIPPMSLAWLQQTAAMPFIIISLFFAPFFLPFDLNSTFWSILAIYTVINTFDAIAYFKALSLSDISFLAPLMSLFVVSNVLFAFIILGQKPSIIGLIGSALIVIGVFLTSKHRKKDSSNSDNDKIAATLVLISVISRALLSNIEVIMLRDSNPTSFNFYSSLFTVLSVLIVHRFIGNRSGKNSKLFWKEIKKEIKGKKLILAIIGLTYMINMLATYQAKLIAPNASYVGAVKQSQVVPMVLIGVFFFKEKFHHKQWLGVLLILCGLIALATN
jgi:drug/metabolite transporter (DMT)-like permease